MVVPRIASTTLRMDRQLVLIVDDDGLHARTLSRSLSLLGYRCLALGPEEAVGRIQTEKFRAIVCDFNMPGLTGNQVLEVVRAVDPDVPFIIFTGESNEQMVIDALNLGADQFLRKPCQARELADTLEKCIASRQASPAGTAPEEFDVVLPLLRPAYQPIVAHGTKRTVAHEVLLRSDHPVFNNPGRVIDFAERVGRVPDLGRRIRSLAMERFDSPVSDSLLFVNLHAQELFDPGLIAADEPLRALAPRVVLEVTERRSIERMDDLVPRIQELRRIGFRIAIDDLGSGYSGLASIVHLEPEFVKLDMSLVRGIERSHVRQSLVKAMTALAAELGTVVVAEGIEAVEELEQLLALGCDWMQGYYFGRPEASARAVPADRFVSV